MIEIKEGFWIHRGNTNNHKFTTDSISSDWKPKDGLIIRTIQTWLEDLVLPRAAGSQGRGLLVAADTNSNLM